MSSSRTARTSTTVSSPSSPSRPEAPSSWLGAPPGKGRVAVIACGALAGSARRAARRHGEDVEVHVLPPLLHNRPERIAPAVECLATRLKAEGCRVAVAYADCGTYGGLDEVCERLGLSRLPGLHCYELLAGATELAALLDDVPGTYLLTDYLVKGFNRLVSRPLGLDRYPELVEDYFGAYERVVWLTEHPTPELRARAGAIARTLGLSLVTRPVSGAAMEAALCDLVAGAEGLSCGSVAG